MMTVIHFLRTRVRNATRMNNGCACGPYDACGRTRVAWSVKRDGVEAGYKEAGARWLLDEIIIFSKSGREEETTEEEDVMKRSIRSLMGIGVFSLLVMGSMTTPAMSGGKGPADGYDLHVQAPHLMADGKIGGPFHHYCKELPEKKVFQCLLFETTDANAPLVAIEYFFAKEIARTLPLIQWHRHFHDHQEEIDTGRLSILDIEDKDTIKAIAEAAGKTDGVIYQLWQMGQQFPDGTVTFPQSIGVQFPQPK